MLEMTPSTSQAIVEFTAGGSPRAVSAAIEAFASERRIVTALVVPWESDAATLRMAITSTKSDGWAIEHTNLGTIVLADLGGERTQVAVLAAPALAAAGDAGRDLDHPIEQRRLLTTFAGQLERKFGAAPGAVPTPGSTVPPTGRFEP